MRPSPKRAATSGSVLPVAAAGLLGFAIAYPSLLSPTAAHAAGHAEVSVQIERVGALEAGHDASWRVTITNHGASAAADLRAVIMLPDGLTFGSSTSDTWSCAAAAMAVTCDRPGELAAGISSSATFSAAVRAGAPRVLKVPVIVTAASDASLLASTEDVGVVTEVLGAQDEADSDGTKVVDAPTPLPSSVTATARASATRQGARSSAAMIWVGALVLVALAFAVGTTRKGVWRIGR